MFDPDAGLLAHGRHVTVLPAVAHGLVEDVAHLDSYLGGSSPIRQDIILVLLGWGV